MKVVIEQQQYDPWNNADYIVRATVENDNPGASNLTEAVELCAQTLKGLGYNFETLEIIYDNDN